MWAGEGELQFAAVAVRKLQGILAKQALDRNPHPNTHMHMHTSTLSVGSWQHLCPFALLRFSSPHSHPHSFTFTHTHTLSPPVFHKSPTFPRHQSRPTSTHVIRGLEGEVVNQHLSKQNADAAALLSQNVKQCLSFADLCHKRVHDVAHALFCSGKRQ